MNRFLLSDSYRCPNIFNVFLSESSISKVQSPPTRTSRRNQSKAKSRPPEPEMDVQLLETLCQENDCNIEEVRELTVIDLAVIINKHTFMLSICLWPNLSFYTRWFCAGEERIPNQFLCFPGITRSFKIPRSSSGKELWLSQHLLHCLVSALTVSISYLFLLAVAIDDCLNVWQLVVALFAALACLFSHAWCQENVCSGHRLLCSVAEWRIVEAGMTTTETGCYCLPGPTHVWRRIGDIFILLLHYPSNGQVVCDICSSVLYK